MDAHRLPRPPPWARARYLEPNTNVPICRLVINGAAQGLGNGQLSRDWTGIHVAMLHDQRVQWYRESSGTLYRLQFSENHGSSFDAEHVIQHAQCSPAKGSRTRRTPGVSQAWSLILTHSDPWHSAPWRGFVRDFEGLARSRRVSRCDCRVSMAGVFFYFY